MLTIQQASQRLKVTKHTLRFWEKKLDGVIVPLRTQGGQRLYTSEHLYVIEEIKRLKRKGLSLVHIKNKLGNSYNAEEDNSNRQRIDLLANQLAEMVRSAVYRFFEGENLD
ncbi:MAG: MerR family transcriptional regulator [Deltaproteobacteria bacterium]|nr:MAG: MerR family transcriptional regulator [Deltaproteobacteria bacterium]